MIVKTEFDINLAIEEMTEEIDTIIGSEVQKFYNNLLQVGRDVRDTGHFLDSFVEPLQGAKIGEWTIRNTADYSPILARGRKPIDGKMYGSLKWFNGLSPMIQKLERDIIKRTDQIKV